uniref:Uncharacterized protein n=1 Tax=Gorilla gorilla gorilla TaxID=9595 RepID=A0A2I2YQD5_GORGO
MTVVSEQPGGHPVCPLPGGQTYVTWGFWGSLSCCGLGHDLCRSILWPPLAPADQAVWRVVGGLMEELLTTPCRKRWVPGTQELWGQLVPDSVAEEHPPCLAREGKPSSHTRPGYAVGESFPGRKWGLLPVEGVLSLGSSKRPLRLGCPRPCCSRRL